MMSIVAVLPWACALTLTVAPAGDPDAASANGWDAAGPTAMDGHTVPADASQSDSDVAVDEAAPSTAAPAAATAEPTPAPTIPTAAAPPPPQDTRFGGRAPNTVYVEAAGPAFLYSVNYDRMVHKFLSVRAGIGYWGLRATASTGDTTAEARLRMLNIPVLGNFLVGRKGHNLEAGAGVNLAFAFGSATAGFGGRVASGSASAFQPFGTATVGYRYTPPKVGFSFRAGFSPLFTKDVFVPWGYLSLGVAF